MHRMHRSPSSIPDGLLLRSWSVVLRRGHRHSGRSLFPAIGSRYCCASTASTNNNCASGGVGTTTESSSVDSDAAAGGVDVTVTRRNRQHHSSFAALRPDGGDGGGGRSYAMVASASTVLSARTATARARARARTAPRRDASSTSTGDSFVRSYYLVAAASMSTWMTTPHAPVMPSPPEEPPPMMLHAEWVVQRPAPPNHQHEHVEPVEHPSTAAAAAPAAPAASTTATIAASTTSTSTTTTAVFLHGLLGSGRNLKTLATRYTNMIGSSSTALSMRGGLLVDLRGHGKSVESSSSSSLTSNGGATIELCARDVDMTLQHVLASNDDDDRTQGRSGPGPNEEAQLQQDLHLVGHSLGGRVALQFCYDQKQRQRHRSTQSAGPSSTSTRTPHDITRLWLLDTVPGAPNESVVHVVNQVEEFLKDDHEKLVHAHGRRTSRQEVATALVNEYQIDAPTAQWLASSYRQLPTFASGGGDGTSTPSSTFAFSVPVAKSLLSNFGRHDFWGQLTQVLEEDVDDDRDEDAVPPLRVDLVVAGKNPLWKSTPGVMDRLDDLQQRHPDRFRVHHLPKAGHWVHVDDLEGLLKVMQS